MTVLEKGKFVKNFVRIDRNGKLIKVPHSNFRGYSANDMAQIEPQIDETYLSNWEKFLHDKYADDALMSQYSDRAHYLFSLNKVEDSDVKKYGLPEDYIVIDEITK